VWYQFLRERPQWTILPVSLHVPRRGTRVSPHRFLATVRCTGLTSELTWVWGFNQYATAWSRGWQAPYGLLSLGIWRHVCRSTTPRCDDLIGGNGVTLADERIRKRTLGSWSSRAQTVKTCVKRAYFRKTIALNLLHSLYCIIPPTSLQLNPVA